jgi:predicted short-subunit dehydrogenase-like oxidoreductase (DUF2520 family)
LSAAAPPRTLVVGHGQLGSALALALGARAPGAAVVWTRGPVAPGERAAGARYVEGDAASAGGIATGCEAVFLAVPDGAVAPAAAALAAAGGAGRPADARPWRGVSVLHAAGALGTEPLRPLAALGAAAAVLHPLRAFPGRGAGTGARPGEGPSGAAALFEGAPFTLAGDERAVEVGRRLVAALGGVLLPSRVEDRAAYHLAAAVASNYGRLLLEWAARRFESAGLAPADARTAASALLRNAAAAGAPASRPPPGGHADSPRGSGRADAAASPPSFTGPVRRGDVSTVEAHLAALHGSELAAYAALGLLLVDEIDARDAGGEPRSARARAAVADALRHALDRAVDEIAAAVAAPSPAAPAADAETSSPDRVAGPAPAGRRG